MKSTEGLSVTKQLISELDLQELFLLLLLPPHSWTLGELGDFGQSCYFLIRFRDGLLLARQ